VIEDNIPKNAKHIGYKCIRCGKELEEEERQQIIALGFWQTWCLLCAFERHPDDKLLEQYLITNGMDTTILDRIKLKTK